jgi:hypothetical protein
MSLSEQTLRTVPVPQELSVDPSLVSELEDSEQRNRVTKLNAGMLAENVKHPDALIGRLTSMALGADASALAGIRSNTVVFDGPRSIERPGESDCSPTDNAAA